MAISNYTPISLVVFSLILVSVSALQPPAPPSAFSSVITLQVTDFSHEESYHGSMYHNTKSGSQLVDIPSDNFARLDRWDLVRKCEMTDNVAKASGLLIYLQHP